MWYMEMQRLEVHSYQAQSREWSHYRFSSRWTYCYREAGIKRVSLELGGNAGTYIDSSADLEHSAKRCVYGAFVNSGQVCISLQRIFVHKSIYDEFADILARETQELKVGSPYDEDTFMGPLINQDALNRAKSWIESAKSEGAEVIAGGVEI